MKKFWDWIHDDSGGRVLRLEGPIDNDNFWGDEVTPRRFVPIWNPRTAT